MVACVGVVTASAGDACDAGRVTISIIIHSISGKPGEGVRQIVAKCDRRMAVVTPQVVVLGMLFTSSHLVCVVVAAYGGPHRVVTDGMLKGVCGLRCGSMVDLALFRRGKPRDKAQRRSGAT